MDARVTILNPWDSQGNQITDGTGIYPCLRGCGGAGYQQGYVLQHMQSNEKVFKTPNSIATDSDHIPVVCLNFQGSKSNNVCTEDGTCYSVNAMHGHDAHVVCFEPGIVKREGNDSRVKIDEKGIVQTLSSRMGTGGATHH